MDNLKIKAFVQLFLIWLVSFLISQKYYYRMNCNKCNVRNLSYYLGLALLGSTSHLNGSLIFLLVKNILTSKIFEMKA